MTFVGGALPRAIICCLIEFNVETITDLSAVAGSATVVEDVVVLVIVPFSTLVAIITTAPAPASASAGTAGPDLGVSTTASVALTVLSVSSSVTVKVVTVVVVVVIEGCSVEVVDVMEDKSELNETAHQEDGAFITSGSASTFPPSSPPSVAVVVPSPPSLVFSGGDEGPPVASVGRYCLLGSRLCTVLNSTTVGSGIAFKISWLEQPAPENSPYKTNLELVTPFLKKLFIETPLPGFHANVAHCWAALTHYVSAKRLAQLRASGIPILVVTGTEDNFVRPSGSYYLHKQLGCKLVVFEGSGHILPSEQTIAYCKLFEELIQKGREGRHEVYIAKANL
ncbi:hypothetical protein BGX26_007054 [Mortierella sp. AD094]|nr:hypothetical protein BGX26_007054 [Mortierella sp. AD094]